MSSQLPQFELSPTSRKSADVLVRKQAERPYHSARELGEESSPPLGSESGSGRVGRGRGRVGQQDDDVRNERNERTENPPVITTTTTTTTATSTVAAHHPPPSPVTDWVWINGRIVLRNQVPPPILLPSSSSPPSPPSPAPSSPTTHADRGYKAYLPRGSDSRVDSPQASNHSYQPPYQPPYQYQSTHPSSYRSPSPSPSAQQQSPPPSPTLEERIKLQLFALHAEEVAAAEARGDMMKSHAQVRKKF